MWTEKEDGVEYKQVLEKEGEIYDGTLVECLGCKQELYLFWNGGELDTKYCCSYMYKTFHAKTTLFIGKADE